MDNEIEFANKPRQQPTRRSQRSSPDDVIPVGDAGVADENAQRADRTSRPVIRTAITSSEMNKTTVGGLLAGVLQPRSLRSVNNSNNIVVGSSSSSSTAKSTKSVPAKVLPSGLKLEIVSQQASLESMQTSSRARKWMKAKPEPSDVRSVLEKRLGDMRYICACTVCLFVCVK